MDFALSKREPPQFRADALFTMPDDMAGPTPDGAGEAGSVVNIGNNYGSTMRNSPNWGSLGSTAISNKATEIMAAMDAAAKTHAAGLNAYGASKGMKMRADAAVEGAGKAAGAATGAMALKTVGQVGGLMLAMSDERTKNHIENIDDALTTLRNLRPVTFHYKEEYNDQPERMHHGFIAQEYMKVVPDATYFDEDKGTYCIDTIDLIGLLVRAIQQLESKVTRLEVKQVMQEVKS